MSGKDVRSISVSDINLTPIRISESELPIFTDNEAIMPIKIKNCYF